MSQQTKIDHPSSPFKIISRSVITLAFYAMLGTGLVALAFNQTREVIENNEKEVLTRQINELIPAESYNNNIETDQITINDPALSPSSAATFFRARQDQLPVALAIITEAPDGYSGAIRILIAVRASDQSLLGVRVISHAETPGLGDKIDASKDPWIYGFDGKSLQQPPLEKWGVKKDGGDFDQFSGATITPRAVVNAVRRTLLYVQEHGASLFESEP
jgi:electron transport complex protein RnfG